jgi:hypothetical protein
MKTFTDVINLWPSLGEFAEDIGVNYVTAQVMKHRDSINSRHWLNVVKAAEARGFEQVTVELLASLKTPGNRPKRWSAGMRVA